MMIIFSSDKLFPSDVLSLFSPVVNFKFSKRDTRHENFESGKLKRRTLEELNLNVKFTCTNNMNERMVVAFFEHRGRLFVSVISWWWFFADRGGEKVRIRPMTRSRTPVSQLFNL